MTQFVIDLQKTQNWMEMVLSYNLLGSVQLLDILICNYDYRTMYHNT